MEAIDLDIADVETDLPAGLGALGLRVGSQLAAETVSPTGRRAPRTPTRSRGAGVSAFTPQSDVDPDAVSYTHLTLPTICSV